MKMRLKWSPKSCRCRLFFRKGHCNFLLTHHTGGEREKKSAKNPQFFSCEKMLFEDDRSTNEWVQSSVLIFIVKDSLFVFPEWAVKKPRDFFFLYNYCNFVRCLLNSLFKLLKPHISLRCTWKCIFTQTKKCQLCYYHIKIALRIDEE